MSESTCISRIAKSPIENKCQFRQCKIKPIQLQLQKLLCADDDADDDDHDDHIFPYL